MDTPEITAPQKNVRLMISYSHNDKEFVEKLYNCFLAQGLTPDDIWIDWEGIAPTTKWMEEIKTGIRDANVFIFVISPDSVVSPVCQDEIEIAAAANKRFIPIMYRELGPGVEPHKMISSHQWITIQNDEDLEKQMPVLVKAINTDLDWLAQHTRLYNRALEWENKDHNDSYLVRGQDLQDALTFISNSAAGKKPAATPLHIEYVQAAQNYATAVRRRNRLNTVVVGVTLALLAVTAFIGW